MWIDDEKKQRTLMAKYLFTYHGGGMPEQEQAEHMTAWGA
jgi:hypothetical protein